MDRPGPARPAPPLTALIVCLERAGPVLARLERSPEHEELAGIVSVALQDAERVRVLENLLRNALEKTRAQVVVEVHCGVDELRFEVCDDGPGFPGGPGLVDLDGVPLDRRVEGSSSTGLGLIVARRIIEAHGGLLRAENQPSSGATVWFTIATPAEADCGGSAADS